VALGALILLLGLAVLPAHAVPWFWASRTIEDRRGELMFGALGLFAAAFFFLIEAR
jgi:hypothetical protein